jgi:hypothetical protein
MSGCCRGLPAKVCIARPYGCADEPLAPAWGKSDAVQAKQAANPRHSPLPEGDDYETRYSRIYASNT